MTGCGRRSLVGTEGREAGVYALRCKSWRCRRCGPRKKSATTARIRHGLRLGDVRAFTVTSPPGEDRHTSHAAFSGRWRRLHERIRRRFGTIEYVLVIKPQRRGAAHAHVVYRGGYIPQRWLSGAAQRSGFGRIVDIRTAGRGIAAYITKSLTAELTDASVAPPAHFRRVRWSRHWGTLPPSRPLRTWPSCQVVHAPPWLAAIIAELRGYVVVEGPGPPGHGVERPVDRHHALRGDGPRPTGPGPSTPATPRTPAESLAIAVTP